MCNVKIRSAKCLNKIKPILKMANTVILLMFVARNLSKQIWNHTIHFPKRRVPHLLKPRRSKLKQFTKSPNLFCLQHGAQSLMLDIGEARAGWLINPAWFWFNSSFLILSVCLIWINKKASYLRLGGIWTHDLLKWCAYIPKILLQQDLSLVNTEHFVK